MKIVPPVPSDPIVVPHPSSDPLIKLAREGKLAQNAETGSFPADTTGHVAQRKLDGWRILTVIGDGKVDFFSRSGKTYNGKLPKIEAELLAALPAGTVLDGEAVALRTEGDRVISEWGTTQSVLTKFSPHAVADKVSYVVFDLLAHGGIDARALSYAKRRVLLERLFETQCFAAVRLIDEIDPTPEAYEVVVTQGFEGVVLKRLNAPYASGRRGYGWVKVKATDSEDVIVMGFKPGENGFAGMVGAVIFGQYRDGELIERGRCSGMDMRTRLDMSKRPEMWLGKVIEVRHMGAMPSGALRHPQFARQRDDKIPAMCVWAGDS